MYAPRVTRGAASGDGEMNGRRRGRGRNLFFCLSGGAGERAWAAGQAPVRLRLESRIDVDLGPRAGIEPAVERLDGLVEADDDVHQRPRVHAAVRVVPDR